VFFNDGSSTEKIEVEYPIGHRRRREEGIPVLEQKFLDNLRTRFPEQRCQQIMDLCLDKKKLEAMPVNDFMEMFVIN
jgi:2-methylcitrate dehydratase